MNIRIRIRDEVEDLVAELIAEEIIVTLPPADPFGIDHDCRNPAGHHFIASCGDVVCVHCSKVVWQ